MARAIARRMVAKLSAKWRSGRERLRVDFQRPSGRGGKMPHTFGNDERVAAQNDRDVMVPARKPPAFVVIESEFVLEILVRALDAPALHHAPHQLLLRRSSRQGAEEAVGRRVFFFFLFDPAPPRLTLFPPPLPLLV